MAGKYKYIVFSSASPAGNEMSLKEWNEYYAKEDKIAEKLGISILFRGWAMGVSEDYVTVYEADKYVDELVKLYLESGRGTYVSSSRTITVVSIPEE